MFWSKSSEPQYSCPRCAWRGPESALIAIYGQRCCPNCQCEKIQRTA